MKKTTLFNVIQTITVAVIGIIIAFPNALRAESDEQVIADTIQRMQSYYASSSDYRASFVQTTSHKMFAGRLQRAYGIVKFKKGGLMRWEYTRPEKKFFIYDGKTLWVYEPEVPQIFSGSADADKLRKALAFLSGEGEILKEYRVKFLDPKRFRFNTGTVLSLIPKDKKSPYKRIELYIDKKTYRVVRSVVVDHENNRNRLDFTNPVLNSSISSQEFEFTPPPGVPIVSPTQ